MPSQRSLATSLERSAVKTLASPGSSRYTRLKNSTLEDESGEIGSSLIIFLVVVGFFMLTVHAMFIFHGNNVIKAAAQDGLDAAQRAGADIQGQPVPVMKAAGEAVGTDRLDLFPGLTDRSVEVVVDQGAGTVTVTVKAKITTPFLVDAGSDLETTVVGPIEQFYEQFERED